MTRRIIEPLAEIRIRWLSAQEGGRRSGPPSVATYASTCRFSLGTEFGGELWSPQVSVLLEHVEGSTGLYQLEFLVKAAGMSYLRAGALLEVMEGPKSVGVGEVVRLIEPTGDAQSP